MPLGSTEGVDLGRMFGENIGFRGGVAPVRAYLDELVPDVLNGIIDPSPVFDLSVDLEHVPQGYAAMYRTNGAPSRRWSKSSSSRGLSASPRASE